MVASSPALGISQLLNKKIWINQTIALYCAPRIEPNAFFVRLMERAKLELEFLFRASPGILYQFLTTPSCLTRWFCDEVDITADHFIFYWGASSEEADLIDDIEEERLRFHWEDADEDEYLEFRILESPVTGETILEITDFCDEDELDDQRKLWETQIQRLQKATGG